MRRRVFLCFALALLPFLANLRLQAQFQQPSKEELQMTADPKAPGAAAVYLNIEEVTEDPIHYHSFYARVKVLQEKGKELATVEIPYQRGDFKVSEIRGRTIHPDGTVIPLTGKPEDLLIYKTKEKQIGRAVFTLPSVEVGSIFEYAYDLRYDDNHFSSPLWQIQRDYFVHKAHYRFTPFKAFQKGSQATTSQFLVDSRGNTVNSLIWWANLPDGVAVKSDATGRLSVDVVDIAPIPKEEWMPPLESLTYHVLFYYRSAFNSADFWMSEAKRWSKDVDHFAEPTKPIREAVASLVAPGDSDVDKARKLYKAVQQLDNTDFTRAKGAAELKQIGIKVAKRAEDTWAQKAGSSEDIALLYLAMVRAAGLIAYDMKVVDRERGVFVPGYLDFDQLDDDVIILTAGGKEIYLDPGEKMCPFQLVKWTHAGASGIRQAPDVRSVHTTPLIPYTANSLTRSGLVTLDEKGIAGGDVTVVMAGQDALRWRQNALRNDPDELKKNFDRWFQNMMPEGMEGHIDHFVGLDDEDVNLIAICRVHGTLGNMTAKRLFVPGFFFATHGRQPFVEESQRIEPIDMHYAEKVTDQMVYQFPTGFTLEGAPQDAKIPWQDKAVFATKTSSEPDKITVASQMLRGFTVLKPEDYTGLRDFYKKIAAANDQQVVFTAATTAKGN